jgi:hypothetical protein
LFHGDYVAVEQEEDLVPISDSERGNTQRRAGRPTRRLTADEALPMKRLGALQANLHQEIGQVESHVRRLEARLDDIGALVTDILGQLDKLTRD